MPPAVKDLLIKSFNMKYHFAQLSVALTQYLLEGLQNVNHTMMCFHSEGWVYPRHWVDQLFNNVSQAEIQL